MAFEKINSLDSDVSINLGGVNKKTGKPNPKTVEGYYLGTKTGIPNKFNAEKPDCLHILQTPKGNVGVWGKSHLNPQMSKAIPGCMVRISFTGTRPSKKGNDQLLFTVEQDTNNSINVESLATSEDTGYSASEEYSEGTNAEGSDDSVGEVFGSLQEGLDNPYIPPVAPKAAAKAPDAARQAKVAALLNGTRNKQTA